MHSVTAVSLLFLLSKVSSSPHAAYTLSKSLRLMIITLIFVITTGNIDCDTVHDRVHDIIAKVYGT